MFQLHAQIDILVACSWLLQALGKNILWVSQLDVLREGAVNEKIPVMSRLFHCLRMQIVPLLPSRSPVVVAIDQARKVWLFVGTLGGDFVEGEGQRNQSDCDVKSSLNVNSISISSCGPGISLRAGY